MWKTVKLEDVATVIAGQSPAGENYNNDGIGTPFMQGKKDYGDKFPNPPTVWTTSVTKLAEKGDILMSVRAPVGALNIANQQVCIGRGLAAIRASEKIELDYLFYALLQISARLEGSSGAIFNSINKKQIEEIEFLLPPLADQQRIVAKLDDAFAEIDKAIETTNANKINALKLYEALSREVFFAGEDVVPLKDIAIVIMGQSPNGKSYNFDGVGTPLVNGPVEFEEGSFGKSKSIKFTTEPTKFCKAGDALLCVRGSTTGRMNLASVDACIGRGVAAIRAHDNQQWINYFLQSARGYIFSIGTGATFPNVSSKQIENIKIRNPKEDEKSELLNKLSNSYEKIQITHKSYDSKILNLNALKSAILAQELQSSEAA